VSLPFDGIVWISEEALMATLFHGWKVLYLCSAIKSTASGKRLTPVPWDTVNDITQEQ
jgi:hypothetical protein